MSQAQASDRPYSSVTVAPATLSGPRFAVDLRAALWNHERSESPTEYVLRRWITRCGWREAAQLLGIAARGRGQAARGAEREAVAEAVAAALARAGVPNRIGLFIWRSDGCATELDAAACLGVLARRSGPLYLPARGFEPSLVQAERLTLVFPMEVHAAGLG